MPRRTAEQIYATKKFFDFLFNDAGRALEINAVSGESDSDGMLEILYNDDCCEGCDQKVTLAGSRISESDVEFLEALVEIGRLRRNDGWVAIEHDDLMKNAAPQARKNTHLKYWGLIERKPKEVGDNKGTSGIWRILPKGEQFLNDGISLTRYLFVFNDTIVGHSAGQTVTVEEARQSKFSYDEDVLHKDPQ